MLLYLDMRPLKERLWQSRMHWIKPDILYLDVTIWFLRWPLQKILGNRSLFLNPVLEFWTKTILCYIFKTVHISDIKHQSADCLSHHSPKTLFLQDDIAMIHTQYINDCFKSTNDNSEILPVIRSAKPMFYLLEEDFIAATISSLASVQSVTRGTSPTCNS